jgi:hypothetical protein
MVFYQMPLYRAALVELWETVKQVETRDAKTMMSVIYETLLNSAMVHNVPVNSHRQK